MRAGPLLAEGRTAEVFAWGDGQVLKLFRYWCPPDWIDYEAEIAQMVEATGLDVPAYGGIVEHEGRRGILYRRVDGRSLLERLLSDLESLAPSAHLLAELHAAMHSRTAPLLPSRRKKLERNIRAAPLLSPESKERILTALAALPDGDSLCHGDFHPGNVLLTEREPVIIDWVDAAHGSPLADVARSTLLITVTEPPAGIPPEPLQSMRRAFHDAYLWRYCDLRRVSKEEIDAWMLPVAAARLGEDIPEENERLLRIVETALANRL